MNEPKRESPDEIRPDERAETVMKFVHQAQKAKSRKDAERQWDEADALMDGDHWKGETLPSWRAKIVTNKVFRTVDKYLALMLRERAEVEIRATRADAVESAEKLDPYIEYLWDEEGWTQVIGTVYEKSVLRHLGFVKTYFDLHRADGLGLPAIEPISVRDLLIHPDATIRNGMLKSKVTIHVLRMSREEIISKYGVDIEVEKERKRRDDEGESSKRSISPFRDPSGPAKSAAQSEGTILGSKTDTNSPEVGDSVTVYEAWIYDEQRVETAELDDPNQSIKPLKYPNGRVITIAEKIVLLDQPNPLNFFPFVPITGTPDSERVYRPSVVNQIASPQFELNKRRSQISDHAALASNPIRLINPQAGIDPDDIDDVTNEPGQSYLDLTGGKGIVFLNQGSLSREVTQGVGYADDDIDDISGIHEAAQGQASSEARSGVAIEALQGETRGRIDLKAMFSEEGLKVMIRNVISMILDFISDERIFAITGDDGQEAFASINPTAFALPRREARIAELEQKRKELILEVEQVQQGQSQDAGNPEQQEQLAEFMQLAQQQVALIEKQIEAVRIMPASKLLNYRIKISVGTRALSARAKSEMAILLHQEPSSTGVGTVLDDVGLFRALKFPGWQRVWKRKQEEIQRQMELQRLQTLQAYLAQGVQPPDDIANPQQASGGGQEIEVIAAALKTKGLDDNEIEDVIEILQSESGQNGTGQNTTA